MNKLTPIISLLILMLILPLASASGFTVNSISTSKPITNNADLSTANLLITVTADGGGQSLVGSLSGDQMTQQLVNLIVKYPLKIEVSNIKETLNYPISNKAPIYTYTWTYGPIVDSYEQAVCLSGYDYCKILAFGYNWIDLYSYRSINIKKTQAGNYGSWVYNDPIVSWNGDVTLTINALPISRQIDTITNPSIDFRSATGTWVGNVKFVGSLVTGMATPNQANFVPTYTTGSTNWKVAPSSYFNDYTNTFTSTSAQLATYIANGKVCDERYDTSGKCSYLEALLSTTNSKATILLSQDSAITTIPSGQVSRTSSSGFAAGGSIVESAQGMNIGNPVLVMTIAAKELNVFIPTGDPEIQSISIPEFASGDVNGIAFVTVKNKAPNDATFIATFIDSTNTFSQVGTSKTDIGAGETKIMSVLIDHGSTSSQITRSAIFTVSDFNSPSSYSSMTKDITMSPPKACIPDPNKFDVRGNVVYRCKSDGSGEEVYIDCTSTSLYYDSIKKIYTCTAPNVSPTPTASSTASPDTIYATNKVWYEGIGGILTLILAAMVIILYRSKK